jgi:hypothetical protein
MIAFEQLNPLERHHFATFTFRARKALQLATRKRSDSTTTISVRIICCSDW